jgi:hypothetical protein
MLSGHGRRDALFNAATAGDHRVAPELLPLVYDEPCKLAAARMADEKPGQTPQGKSLVHQVYAQLVDDGDRIRTLLPVRRSSKVSPSNGVPAPG